MTHEPWEPARAAGIIADHATLDGATLPILHALQKTFGYIDDGVIPLIADALNLSRAEVFGVITFYHDFRRAPGGRHVVKLCRAEACQSVGAVALADHAKRSLGVDWHETTPDGRVTLDPVFCLGLCACGPAALVDDEPVSGLDPAAFDRRLMELRA
jgi:formate dehydrogenase subunit gamma